MADGSRYGATHGTDVEQDAGMGFLWFFHSR